jgi:Tol biopolymer transport system component
VSADGRTILFVRVLPQRALMRVSTDGSNLQTLRQQPEIFAPVLSADGQTVDFASTKGGTSTLWSMPLAGGPPRQLGPRASAVQFAISHDGRTGAFVNDKRVVVLCDLPDCTNVRPAGTPVHGAFTPDGRGFAYTSRADPKNIWVQPVGGGEPRSLTHFTDRYTVSGFAFSVGWPPSRRGPRHYDL